MEVDKEKRKLEEDRELSPTSKRRRWNNNNNNNNNNDDESVKKQEKETKEEKPKTIEASTSASTTTTAGQQIPERLQKRLNFNTKKPETEVKVNEPVEDIKPEGNSNNKNIK